MKTAFALAAAALLLSPGPTRAEKAADDNEPGSQEPLEVGFEIGMFELRMFRPVQGEKVRVSFTLYATTDEEMADEFEQKLEERRMRLRDQVVTAMRLAEPEEFADPELRLIRRRLFLRLYRAAPTLGMKGIYFSDFRYFVE